MRRAIGILLLVVFMACVPADLPKAQHPRTPSSPTPSRAAPTETSPAAASPTPVPTTWQRLYDNNGQADAAWDVLETPEGDFVVVGATGPTSCLLFCNSDGWVIKIDPQGNLLWSRQFGGNGADLLTSVILVGDNYLISGSKYVFPYARQAWLLALASDGSVVWEKTFGGPQGDSANEVIPVPGEGFLMAGQTKSFGTGDGKSDVWLVALDAGGNTRWTKTYNLGSEDMGTSIAPFGSGRFIIATTPCTANCDNLFRQGFARFIVVDAAGNILTSQTFTEGPKNALGKVKPTRDGGAVLVGSTSVVENFPSADTWGVKLDSQANVV